MSEGNSGPEWGSGDHPSDDYINVAASTTGGTYASGELNVITPPPNSDTLEIAYGTADFGKQLEPVLSSLILSPRLLPPILPTKWDVRLGMRLFHLKAKRCSFHTAVAFSLIKFAMPKTRVQGTS